MHGSPYLGQKMKTIQLLSRYGVFQGNITLSDSDYDLAAKHRWHIYKVGNCRYAVRYLWNGGDRRKIYLHSELMIPARELFVDPVDCDAESHRPQGDFSHA